LVVSFSLVDGRNHHPNLDVVFLVVVAKFVVCPAVFFTWSIVSSWKITSLLMSPSVTISRLIPIRTIVASRCWRSSAIR